MRVISRTFAWIGKRSLVTKIIAAILIITLAGWGYHQVTSPKTQTPQLQTTPVTKGTLVSAVSASGTVTAANSRSVTTNATGVVKKVNISDGGMVKAGAPILELDLDLEAKQSYSQAVASYQAAKNNLESAQTGYYTIQADMLKNWDSYKTLAESDTYKDTTSANRTLPEFMVSQDNWLSSEAKYKQQQAVVAQAQTALNAAALSLKEASPIVYAPISGTITGLSLQIGSVIAPTESSSSNTGTTNTKKIANIITQAYPAVTANLTEVDVTKIAIGDKVTIEADALTGKTFTGSVVSIDTVGTVSSGVTSYPAVIQLDTAAPDLYANMSVTSRIITDTRDDALLIPSSAIMTQNGTTAVRVKRNGQVQVVPIETGVASDTQTEVLQGLSEGDQVVTSTGTNATTPSRANTTSVFSGFGGMGGARLR